MSGAHKITGANVGGRATSVGNADALGARVAQFGRWLTAQKIGERAPEVLNRAFDRLEEKCFMDGTATVFAALRGTLPGAGESPNYTELAGRLIESRSIG